MSVNSQFNSHSFLSGVWCVRRRDLLLLVEGGETITSLQKMDKILIEIVRWRPKLIQMSTKFYCRFLIKWLLNKIASYKTRISTSSQQQLILTAPLEYPDDCWLQRWGCQSSLWSWPPTSSPWWTCSCSPPSPSGACNKLWRQAIYMNHIWPSIRLWSDQMIWLSCRYCVRLSPLINPSLPSYRQVSVTGVWQNSVHLVQISLVQCIFLLLHTGHWYTSAGATRSWAVSAPPGSCPWGPACPSCRRWPGSATPSRSGPETTKMKSVSISVLQLYWIIAWFPNMMTAVQRIRLRQKPWRWNIAMVCDSNKIEIF